MTYLAEVRAMALARDLVQGQLEELVVRALEDGADRSEVAHILGVSRSGLYRGFGERLRQQRQKGSDQ